MLIVPSDAEGVDIQAIHTIGGERTNTVTLSQVRVPDANRVGEVDQGRAVIRFALGLEQAMGFAELQERFVENAGRWALARGPDGGRPLDDPPVKGPLAQIAIMLSSRACCIIGRRGSPRGAGTRREGPTERGQRRDPAEHRGRGGGLELPKSR